MATKIHQFFTEQSNVELKYRNRIIQLTQELEYERRKSEQYQRKFQQIIRSPTIQDQQQGSVQHYQALLSEKETELHQLRLKLIQFERQKIKQVLNADLMRENQELRNAIEQIKDAVIQTLNQKEEEISILQKKAYDQKLINTVDQLTQKNQILTKINQEIQIKHEKQIQQFQQRIMQVTKDFAGKLAHMEEEIHAKKNFHSSLVEKAGNLQEDLSITAENLERYQKKVKQSENTVLLLKLQHQQQIAKLKIEYTQLEDRVEAIQREKLKLQGKLNDYKFQQMTYHDKIANLQQQKQQFNKRRDRKRKVQQRLCSSFMCASPEQLSKNVGLFSSFLRGQQIQQGVQNEEQDQQMQKGSLTQIKEMEQKDVLQNFTGYTDLEVQQYDQEESSRREPIEENREGNHYLNSQQKKQLEQALENIQRLTKEMQGLSNSNSMLSEKLKEKQMEIKSIQEKLQRKQDHIRQISRIDLISKDEKNSLQQKNTKLLQQIKQLTSQNNQINLSLKSKKAQLTSLQKAARQKDKELIIEGEKTKQYMNKLQNSLLTQKLKLAESQDYFTEKHDQEKAEWTAKLVLLTEQVARLEAIVVSGKKKKANNFSILG